MADRVDAATRSRIMRAIRSRDTKPELALAKALRKVGLTFRRHVRRLPGSPDFVVAWSGRKPFDIAPHRLAIFCHGCFWHLCPKHYKAPASEGWRRKMDANRRRDIRVRRKLRALGWRTIVVWEHESPSAGAARVLRRCLRET